MRVLCVGPNNPMIQEFETANQFHESRPGYLANLYDLATPEDPFSEVIKYNSVRLMVSAPVTIGRACRRVPFLIDTGCGQTMVHQITFDRFLKADQPVPQRILIGRHQVSITHSRFTTDSVSRIDSKTGKVVRVEIPHLLGYLNILGMDFLNEAVPDLHRYLHDNLSRYQPPLDIVEVTDGAEVFGVRPERPVAWALKKAIADYRRWSIDPVSIRLRDPSGRELAGKDPLHAGIEYAYEVSDAKGQK
jgi:hypothetical protein